MLKRMKKLLCCLMLAAVICGGLWTGNTASAAGAARGPADGVKDICAFLPYSGTEKDHFSVLEDFGKKLAEYTGGELKTYKGTEATIDRLADALETCAVVLIGSHGIDPGGRFGLTTDAGLTTDDYSGGHAKDEGDFYKKVDGKDVLDYHLWSIDGTVIASHMTKDAPNSLVILKCCMSMKNDRLCAPLRGKGVAVVYGYSESISNGGGETQQASFIQALCEGNTVAQAISAMKQETGRWDPMYLNYTLAVAQESEVAFPIVVSEEDVYPGAGNVNKEQTVKSGWLLPIRTDVPQKIVLPLNASVGDKVIAINCKSAKIAAGGLPQGVSFHVGGDGALRLSGTPTKKGYTAATFHIVTTHNGTVSKPVGVMVADTAHATVLPTQETFLTAEKHGTLGTDYLLTNGNCYEIPLAFTSQHVNTFLLRKYSGYLPYTLTYDAEGEGETRWRIVSTNWAFDLYSATPPGLYEATMELITYPGGDVYRLPVSIAVAPGYTRSWKKEYSVRRYDSMANAFSEWKEKAAFIKSIAVTSGSLPKGVTLRNSYYYPFGLYGAPTETGDFTAQVRVTSYNNAHDYTITIHVEDVPKITGTVKLTYPGDHPFAGEKIQAVLTDVPTPNKIQWEDSSDGVKYTEKTTTGATFKSNPKFTGKAYIRAKVTATGYGGALYSDPTYVTEALDLTGGISYLTGVAVGQQIKTQLTGTLGSIYYSLAPEIVHFQWQASEDGSSGWSDIPGATEKSYTPAESDAGMYLRLKATADRYKGEVYSTARQLAQTAWTVDPEKPYLTIASPYDAVTVTNAKANQEYTVSYAYNTVDWTHSAYPDADGALSLPAEKDRTVYVYTRMRKTAAHPAGAKNECRAIYNGYTTALAGLVLDHTTVTTRVGEVTVLTVSPLPEDFSGWNDSYTVKWGTSGSGVTLFANPACSIPVTLGTPSSHKTVYAKGTAASNHCQVSVEKQVGYTDLRRAVCDFAVADASGNFNLEYLNFDEVILMPDETATVGYTTHPSPALVGVVSFVKTQGPGDLTLTANGDGTVSVSAPADAPSGKYYYEALVDGASTLYKTTVYITVLGEQATVTLDANNGTGQTEESKAANGSGFVLPEKPAGFTTPVGFIFDGWDLGKPGDSITILGDVTVKAQWMAHTHTMQSVPAAAATCVLDGNTAYYFCDDCGRYYEDAAGTLEAPGADYFKLPAKGHTPGAAVKENDVKPTCITLGSYDMAVYCTVCKEELTRTHTTLPYTGHTLKAVPEKKATCTEKGNKAHYVCTGCASCFEDAAGTVEILDTSEWFTDALGHNWADWKVAKKSTVQEEGEEERVCKRCGKKETRSVARLGVASYTVTVKAGAHGSASASAATAEAGAAIAISAEPYGGYQVSQVTYTPKGGLAANITSAMNFTMPAANVTVEVSFKPIPDGYYSVTVMNDGNGTASAAPVVGLSGTQVTLTAAPKDGYQLKEWQVLTGGVAVNDNKFKIGTANVGIKAVFVKDSASAYLFTKGNGAAWTKGSGETLDFTVKGSPDDAKTFARFTGIAVDGADVAAGNFTASPGSVNLSLKAKWLETLAEGGHTIRVKFTDGSAEAKFTINPVGAAADPSRFDSVAVPSDTFTFRKVWMGDTEKSIDFTLYKQGGEVYHHCFDKRVVSDREWRYNAWFSAPAACYVIEKPIPGYQTKYVNVGVYEHVTDRCCDGGTIINKKIPKTGDESNPALWAGLMLAGIAGLTALALVKKRRKAGK